MVEAMPQNAPARVCVAGPLLLTLTMGALAHEPRLGDEQASTTSWLAPGGSANRAVALAHLGLDAELLCSIGVDEAGALVRDMLLVEGVDLRWASRVPTQALRSILESGGRRAVTTFGQRDVPPLATLRERPDALVCELGVLTPNLDTLAEWRPKGVDGTWVLAECRWDTSGAWAESDLAALDRVNLFSLGEAHACKYARVDDARRAARELAWRVPDVVITKGDGSILAIVESEEIALPPMVAKSIDASPTEHAFSAALVWAKLNGLSARAALSMAALASARSTEKRGSFTDSPTLGELQEWTRRRDVPAEYDLSFLDVPDVDPAQEPTRVDNGSPDDDIRDDSAFESAHVVADALVPEEVEIHRQGLASDGY